MLGFKIVVFSLLWWFAGSVPNESGTAVAHAPASTHLMVSGQGTAHHAIIVENSFKPAQASTSFRFVKVPYALSNGSVRVFNGHSYNPRLSYFSIAKHIPLRFTTKAIIFPFHTFT